MKKRSVKTYHKRENLILIMPMVIIVLLIGIAPFGEAVVTSFFHDIYGKRSPAGWDNFRYILSDRGFFYSMKISLLWSFLNTLISLGVSLLLAWRLSRSPGKKRLLYTMLLVPWGIPVYIAVPVWRSFFHGDGGNSLFSILSGIEVNLLTDPTGAFFSTLWVSLWMSVPFTTFLFWGAMKKIPQHLFEAARMDGADSFQLFRWICIPQLRGSLAAMGVVNFIRYLKEFNTVFLMTTGGPPMVSGITDRHIIGATTTLDVLLYEVFNSTEDLGISSAYAVCLGFVILAVMGLWILFRKEKLAHGSSLAAVFVSQLILGGPFGVVWGGFYVLAGWRKPFFFPVLILLNSLEIIRRISLLGFFEGFSPAILLTILLWLLIIKRRHNGSLPDSLFRSHQIIGMSSDTGLFKPLLILMEALFILSAVLVLFIIVWLSFSGLGSCYIDTLIPPFVTAGNYRRVLVDEGILRFFFNTLIVSASAGLIVPLIILPAAQYLLQKGQKQAFMVISALQIISLYGGMHTLIPLYALFRRMHLIDTYIPLVMIYLNSSFTTGLLTSLAFLEKIPASYREAARLEGARQGQYFRMVFLPLSIPVVFTNGILAFLAGWNSFMAPMLFLNREENFTISVKLFSMVGNLASGQPRWNLFAAASVLNCFIIGGLFYHFKNPLQTTALSDDLEG